MIPRNNNGSGSVWNIIKLVIQLLIAIAAWYFGNSQGYQQGCQEEAGRQEHKFLERLRRQEAPAAAPTATPPKKPVPGRPDFGETPTVYTPIGKVKAIPADWTPLDDKYAVPEGDRLIKVYPKERAVCPSGGCSQPRFPVLRRLFGR